MSSVCIEELEACIFSLSKAASKFADKCGSAISNLQKLQATTCAQWQRQTDQGWVDYEQSINDLLESAHRHSRSIIKFRLNGNVYTADLSGLVVQKQYSEPYTRRAIRRSVTAGDLSIAAMVQMVEMFKHEFTECEHQLITDLRATVTATGSDTVKQVAWECDTDSGWVAYSAALSAMLETGHKVSTMHCNVLSYLPYCVLPA
jgi:WWE domain